MYGFSVIPNFMKVQRKLGIKQMHDSLLFHFIVENILIMVWILPDFGSGMDQWWYLGFRSTVNKCIPYCHIANFEVLAFRELEETK